MGDFLDKLREKRRNVKYGTSYNNDPEMAKKMTRVGNNMAGGFSLGMLTGTVNPLVLGLATTPMSPVLGTVASDIATDAITFGVPAAHAYVAGNYWDGGIKNKNNKLKNSTNNNVPTLDKTYMGGGRLIPKRFKLK